MAAGLRSSSPRGDHEAAHRQEIALDLEDDGEVSGRGGGTADRRRRVEGAKQGARSATTEARNQDRRAPHRRQHPRPQTGRDRRRHGGEDLPRGGGGEGQRQPRGRNQKFSPPFSTRPFHPRRGGFPRPTQNPRAPIEWTAPPPL